MSVVSNVIMVTIPLETREWEEMPILRNLVRVDQLAGGSKRMECDVFIGAYNHLDHAEILREFRSVAWACEKDAQLMIKGQEDETFTIYRANHLKKLKGKKS